MSKIYIDAGHGGHDPGALGARSKEKDNVLKVALRLKTLLEGHGHTVKLSRSTDVFLQLGNRAALANKWGADYFLSLHNNSAGSSAATGFETFIYTTAGTRTAAFQNAVHNAIAGGLPIVDRGKKKADYAVLRLTNMPAVLIEYAFINNTKDEAILIHDVEKLAQLTAQGVVNYVGSNQVAATPSKPQTAKPKPNHTPSESHAVGWEWATKEGFVNGERPKENLTREQFASVLMKVVEGLKSK